MELGTIQQVDLHEIWPNETKNFTPWLAENLQLLSDLLGTFLELEGVEVPVGAFSLDILARDTNSGALVTIENQMARTDHAHLGQLLTYSAGSKAQVVVWVASKFRDEHRETLDWLNENTRESLSFFGVEIELIRIEDSPPAPLLRLVAAPHEWTGQTHDSPALTPSEKKYIRFWYPLLEELRKSHGWNIKTENKRSYYSAGSGARSSMFGSRMRFTDANEVRVEMVISSQDKDRNKVAFDLLKESSANIEEKLGPLTWERLDDAKESRIVVSRPGHIDDSDEDLGSIREWLIEHLMNFRTVLAPYLKNALEKTEGPVRTDNHT